MLKRVTLYTDPQDTQCDEVKSFLEEQDIRLHIRNIKTEPLGKPEISMLLRHFDLRHFLNAESRLYKKNKLDKSVPGRDEVIDMIATDNELLRVPIIVFGRLMTVGCNREKIIEMLQIKNNGHNPSEEDNSRSKKATSRSRK